MSFNPAQRPSPATDALAISELAKASDSPKDFERAATEASLVGLEHVCGYRQLADDTVAAWNQFSPLARAHLLRMAERLEAIYSAAEDRRFD